MSHLPSLHVLLRRQMLAVLAALLLLVGPARAEETVSLDFVNTDIAAVAKAVGYITNRNFILDPRVKGTINIVSSRPVPKAQVYDVFLSALRTQGYTVAAGRGAYKIVPEAEAKLNYTATSGKSLKAGDSGLVTQVYPLQFSDAAQLMPVLRPLISPNNVVSALTVGNMLVITDYADNLRRIDRLIEAMDQPAGQDTQIIRLKYAVASDVAGLIQKLIGDDKMAVASQRVAIAADTRSNVLLVRSDNPSRMERVRQLAAELDTPDGQTAGPRVIRLRNADASRLVQTLRGAVATEGSGFSAPTAATDNAAGSAGPLASSLGKSSSTPGQGGTASLANGQLQILADTASNAIILVGPAVLQAQYAQLIEKLDSRPAEVFIEALIVEMTANKAEELGIQWQFLKGSTRNSSAVIGGTNFGTTGNILAASQDVTTVNQGLNVGIVNGTLTVPIGGTNVQILNLNMLANALQSQAGTHILSAPNLLTLDNEEAQIVVGQNVPFVTGQYTINNTGGSTSPFQTVERQDVGLKLKVKPQIAEDGSIRLKLYQEVSSVQSTSSTYGPTTNKRSIDTTVMVDDKHIVVLGGLMQDTYEDGVSKVPLLGDLPVVGALFRNKARSQVKTDLYVFIRPVVVRDRKGLADLSAERFDFANDQATGVKRRDMPLDDSAASQLWPKPEAGQAK